MAISPDKATQLAQLAAQPADDVLFSRAMMLSAGRIDMAMELQGLIARRAPRADVHDFIERCKATKPASIDAVIDSVCKSLGVTATTAAERLQAMHIASAHEQSVLLKQVMWRLDSMSNMKAEKPAPSGDSFMPFVFGALVGYELAK